MGQRWTEDEIKILNENYGRISNKELSSNYLPERNLVSIKTMAGKCGLTKESGEVWTDEELQIVKDNYGKLPQAEFKEQALLNRTWIAIKHKAHEYNLDGTSQQLNTKYSHNTNYFTAPSQDSAYWAGFIAADGCIGKKWNLLTIGLARADRDHLSTFQNNIDYTGRVYDYSAITNGVICYSSHLYISGAQQIVYDLNMHYNITPKKSLTLQPPNITDEDLIKCFMVGYIDGDGCIDKTVGELRLSIMGTKPMMVWMKDKIDSWYPTTYANRQFNISKRGNIYQIRVAGKRAVTILTDLSTYNLPVLRRKWDKVSKYI
jgi:hypothetical protein